MVKPSSSLVLSFAFLLLSAGTLAVSSHGQQPATAKTAKPTAAAPTAAKPVTAAPKPATAEGPPVLPHPHKVYEDDVQNKLFWPMDMHFWIRLSASPDANAPSYLLQRVAPEADIKSDITTEQLQKEGIELEIRNKQYIRWYNYITKQTVYLQFFSDGDAPVTKTTCVGAPTAVVAEHTYFGKGLHCSLSSEDELSGVDTTYVSLNDAPWKPYAKELVLDREGAFALRAYAVDHVGWAETPTTMKFTVDLTAPSTTHSIVGNAIDQVLSTQASFHIASTDALSGVETILARIDREDFKPVTTGEVKVSELPDGEHTLNYYSIDRVTNREVEHSVPFYLDRTPPTSEFKVIGDLFMAPSGTRYVSRRSKVELTAQDNKIGVDWIQYSLTPGQFQTYSQPFLMPPNTGAAKVEYKASDKLHNTSAVATMPYYMDITPPVSAYKTTGPVYQERTDVYITKDSRVEFSSTDDASGVSKIEYYSIVNPDDAPHPMVYTGPVAFPTEARRLVRFWGTDKVNNRETDKALVLITDNTPPVIFANFSLDPNAPGSESNGTQGGVPVYRRFTNLFLGAQDNASGVKKITYALNGAKEVEYHTPVVFEQEGTFDMLIRAEDNLGNISTKSLHFVIKG
jgi:hypothetical protein